MRKNGVDLGHAVSFNEELKDKCRLSSHTLHQVSFNEELKAVASAIFSPING